MTAHNGSGMPLTPAEVAAILADPQATATIEPGTNEAAAAIPAEIEAAAPGNPGSNGDDVYEGPTSNDALTCEQNAKVASVEDATRSDPSPASNEAIGAPHGEVPTSGPTEVSEPPNAPPAPASEPDRSASPGLPAGSLLDLAHLRGLGRFERENAVRARSQTVYLGNQTVLGRALGRYKIYLPTTDVGLSPHIMMDGYWEMWLTELFLRMVKPGMVAVDVGANLGYYSLLLADLVGPTGKMIAVEPNPEVARLLKHSLAVNGFWHGTCHASAASDGTRQTVRFFVPEGEPKNGHIIGDQEQASRAGNVVEVPAATLDSLLGNIRPDIIKIDVEGAEHLVYAGLEGTILRHRPIIVLEYNVSRLDAPLELALRIKSHYPQLRFLDLDGQVKPVTLDDLARRNVGEDWLLYLSPHAEA